MTSMVLSNLLERRTIDGGWTITSEDVMNSLKTLNREIFLELPRLKAYRSRALTMHGNTMVPKRVFLPHQKLKAACTTYRFFATICLQWCEFITYADVDATSSTPIRQERYQRILVCQRISRRFCASPYPVQRFELHTSSNTTVRARHC